MKTSTALPLALALGLSLGGLLAACDNSLPVYASIQEEQPGAKEGLFYRASVGGVLKFGGKYYAQRSTLAVSSSGTEGTWSTVSITDLGTDYACTGLAADGTALYAAINGKGLYKSTDGSSWSLDRSDTAIDQVFAANGQILYVDHSEGGTSASSADDTWTIKWYGAGTDTVLGPRATSPYSASVKGIAYANGLYWAATDIGLYSAGSAGAVFVADSSGGPTGKLDSILASPSVATRFYVGTDAGVVWAYNAGTWTSSSSLTYAVTALCEVPTASGTRLLAGLGANTTTGTSSVSYGYSILDPAALGSTTTDSGTIASSSTNYSTTLYQKPINAFCYDGTVSPARLFAATASAGITGATGLFTATWDGSAWSGWSTE